MRRLLVMCALLALVAQAGVAAIPETMSYQGVLTDALGSPVPDGFYNLTFRIYVVPVAGVSLWTETQNVFVEDGIFDVILGDVNPMTLLFDTQYYLATQVGAAPELTPRTKLTAAAYAFRAKYADTGAPDTDWVISGNDIWHILGSVGIGSIPPPGREMEREKHGVPVEPFSRGANKLYVEGVDQKVVFSYLYNSSGNTGTAALFGYRTSDGPSHGTDFSASGSNAAVTGYNYWGDNYAFGVSGFSWFDYGQCGGVLGAHWNGDTWGALGYYDGTHYWGIYTPDATYLGGPLRIPTGATNGYVLTSDASGNATWQASTGGVGGGGTANYLPKFTAATTLGNSIAYETGGRVGIGTTSPISRLTVYESTSGQAFEVNSTYAGGAGRLVDFSRTNDPSGGNDMLQIVVPSTAPDDFQFIECERGSGGFQFVVDGDGLMETQGGVVSQGPVDINSTLDVTTTTTACASFQTNAASSSARPVYAEYTGTGTTDAAAVEGVSEPTDWYGIGGKFSGGYHGVEGRCVGTGSNSYYGVYGRATGGSGTSYGVYGYASSTGTAYAGYFSGDLRCSGTLSKGAGAFVIDHPLDPANKVLRHSFVESPDMMNIYNGNVVLDASGAAWVEMPEWFDELNVDFRYQLTSIGAPGPNLYVATEMTGTSFQIAGGEAGMKVSWQVTGIRNDAFARANRIVVEENKPATQVGKYLHPEALGLPASLLVDHESNHSEKGMSERVPPTQPEVRDRTDEQ